MSRPRSRAPFPHCDSLVLHTPGRCEHCDLFPDLQWQRLRNSVQFTGERPRDGLHPCPSTERRTVELIERWPGNRPGHGPTITETPEPAPADLGWLRRLWS